MLDFCCGINGAQSDLVEAQSRLAISQIELRKAVIQLQTSMNVNSWTE